MSDARKPARRALALIQAEPWAITREALAQIFEIAARENRSLEAIEAELGRPLDNTYEATVRDGIATIRLTGPLFRYANLFTRLSGATSLELVAGDLGAALRDASVRGILLAIDSPGGTVSGTSELADLIYAARAVKPVWAHIDGLGASAAYWIGSAAAQLTASDTSLVGSLGVVMVEELQDDPGTIEFVSSQTPRKRTDPVEELGRAERQAIVDALAERFIETVARNRGVSADQVREEFGQGGLFVGPGAAAAGLVDGISTFEQVHAALVEESAGARFMLPVTGPAFTAGHAAGHTPTELSMKTTAKQAALAATAAAAATKAEDSENEDERKKKKDGEEEDGEMTALTPAELAAQHPAAAEALRAEGAAAERARILAIQALAIPGHEAVIAAAVEDGSTPEAAALKIVQAQRAAGTAAATTPAAAGGAQHLARLAGDEAQANAPSAQRASEPGLAETVASIVQFASLRRADAAAPAAR